MTTNYDEVASSYDGRYARHDYAGTADTLRSLAGTRPRRTLELGCGTGHWIDQLRAAGHLAAGIDPSRGMLHKAAHKLAAPGLTLARAERLPFADASFELVYAINAIHHFGDPSAAIAEAHRVLSPSGTLLIIGLDPAAGRDSWAIYDFFPGTLDRDLERYPSTAKLGELMEAIGFERVATGVAEHIDQALPARQALATGALHKHVTSQLTELTDAAYERGIAAIEASAAQSEARGESLVLSSSLYLFATTGVKPAR